MVEKVFVCPECGTISRGVGETVVQEINYVYIVDEDDFTDDYVETVSDKYYCLECGHEIEGDIDDYVCIVDRERKIIEPDGVYWIKNVNELRKIAKKNCLRVDVISD